MPVQIFSPDTLPAFLAIPASQQADIAVGEEVTVVFGTEVFDIGGNFSSNTFTAPVTGKYQLSAHVALAVVDTGSSYYYLKIITSNRSYRTIISSNALVADPSYWSLSLSVLADMDAGDTAYVVIRQGEGAQQTDIDVESFFSGHLVC